MVTAYKSEGSDPFPLVSDLTAGLLRGIKESFDAAGLLNPGKVHPAASAEFAAPRPVPQRTRFAWESLTVTAPAGAWR